jgi:ribosomal subunit interface protein
MALAWNIVAKNFNPHEQLQDKLRDKISKLERYLQHFPPGGVHLQVTLDRLAKKGLFKVSLTLRVPLHILRSEKSASDPVPALDQAVKALLRELAALKSAMRREEQWKRRARRKELHEAKPLRFTPEPLAPGEGPQTLQDLVRELVEQQYGRLLYYVRLQIWRAETEATISKHALDAEAVADEVARQAISQVRSKPGEQSFRVWLYGLARHELDRRFEILREEARTTVPLDAATELESEAERVGSTMAGRLVALDGPSEAEISDEFADEHLLPPDLAAAERDLVDYLHHAAEGWLPEERGVFELHFLEGFEPDEVAMLQHLKTAEVKKVIGRVQERLRELLAEALQAKVSALTYTLGQRK